MNDKLREQFPNHFLMSRANSCRKRKINEYDTKEISKLFEKKFNFKKNDESWCLPCPEMMFMCDVWMIDELQEMKYELNSVKSKLNDFNLEDWHKHTRMTSRTGNVFWKLKNEYKPEFLTQAWCKLYENLMSFPLIPSAAIDVKELNSIHLCEAPGGFVASLNHFLKLHHSEIKWHWKAATLNPYYEGNSLNSMINDDRLIFQTLPFWNFGCDYTGNIMNFDNIDHLSKDAREMGNILLVTADGSIDCHDKPAEQEREVSFLQYCETMTALNVLGNGSNFLLKIFTIFEAQTVCLLYLLCCAFSEVSTFKPATSKEGNSEMYVVCLNYNGRDSLKPFLEKLKDFIVSENKAKVMFPLDSIPQSFIKQVLLCSAMYKDLQIETIENNIKTYGDDSCMYNIKRLKYLTTQYFIEHYQIERLPDKSKEIVGEQKLNEIKSLNLDSHAAKGSFTSNEKEKNSNLKNRLLSLYNELQECEVIWSMKSNIKWFKLQSLQSEFSMITGKPINVVYSSKFCSRRLLNIWNDFRESTANVFRSDNKCFPPKSDDESEDLKNILNDNLYVQSNMNVVRIENEYWNFLHENSNEKSEKNSFCLILDAITRMKKEENLLLLNFPLFTQFNVGLMFIIMGLFSKVGFINPFKVKYGIIFVGFQPSNDRIRYLKDVQEVCLRYNKSESKYTVLSVVPIIRLCGKQDISNGSLIDQRDELSKVDQEIEEIKNNVAFSCCITEMNNIFLKNTMCESIFSLIPER